MSATLGVDVGSTNLKVVVLDDEGRLAGRTTRALETHGDGARHEQDADRLWARLVDAMREVTDRSGLAGEVGTIGVCSQYSSIVPVDGHARPVGPMVMWRDHRGTARAMEILAAHEDAFMLWVERHGIPPVGGGLSLGHLLALEHDTPDQHARTRWYLEPMDYVVARMTGRVVATQHSMFTSQLCDNRTVGARRYDDELLAAAGLDAATLPPLCSGTEPVGTLTAAVAAELGLPSSVTVLPGINDTAAVARATGAQRDGAAGVAIGTTSVVVDTVPVHKVDLEHEILAMPGPDDDYLVFAENGLGGQVLHHVMDELVVTEDVLGTRLGDDAFGRFDHAIDESEPGASGALFLPWLAGSLAPSNDPTMRGGFINLSMETRRVDLVRAAAEGVVHNLVWLLGHVDGFVDEPAAALVFVGGVARSARMCQILADVSGRSVGRTAHPEVAVATAVARRASELGSGRAPDRSPDIADTFHPDGDLHARYREDQVRFQRAHGAMAEVLAPVDAARIETIQEEQFR